MPLIIGGAGPEIMDLDLLSASGVRICLQGHQPIAAAYNAVYNTMKSLREGTRPSDLDGLPSGELTAAVKRNADYERWIDDYLGGK